MDADSVGTEPKQAHSSTATDTMLGLKHLLEPDFSGERLEIPADTAERMRKRLTLLYGEDEGPEVYNNLECALAVHYAYMPPALRQAEKDFDTAERFTEKDVILITYGDLIEAQNMRPLAALADFAEKLFHGLITTLHILPFYPYSSDRGFAVINYGEVDPRLGTWEDIAEIGESFKLMFDGVVNHCSSKSKWFRRFLGGDRDYGNYFISFDSPDAIDDEHLKKILRPRTSGLLTRFDTIDGPKYVWTTFSKDQVDLNFKHPRVLLKTVRILLDYVRRGADIIRLDAITYLWRELGTSCAHLEQTHEVVKLLRDVLDAVAPHVAIITETNVPHEDNITYFGDGCDEAQMVYNFALPPLVLHTFLTGDATVLSGWADRLVLPTDRTAFFNFLDSHDGIGILGAKGFLSDAQIDALCDSVRRGGGFVSMTSTGNGEETPYELNTTWFSALHPPGVDEPEVRQEERFMASRAVALVLRGVPGIYMLSMFASKNDLEAVSRDGVKRSINRSRLYEDKILEMFLDRNSTERHISERFMSLLEARVNEAAFHPNAPQEVLDLGSKVFCVKRTSVDGASQVLCIINVANEAVTVDVPLAEIGMTGDLRDLLCADEGAVQFNPPSLELKPYQVSWFKKV